MLYVYYPCPRADQLWQRQIGEWQTYRNMVKKYETDIRFLRNKTGLPLENFLDVWSVWDPLNCEVRCSNLPVFRNQQVSVFEPTFECYTNLKHQSNLKSWQDCRTIVKCYVWCKFTVDNHSSWFRNYCLYYRTSFK